MDRGACKTVPGGALHVWEGPEITGQLEFAWFEAGGHVHLYYLRPDKRGAGYGSLLHAGVTSTLRGKSLYNGQAESESPKPARR